MGKDFFMQQPGKCNIQALSRQKNAIILHCHDKAVANKKLFP